MGHRTTDVVEAERTRRTRVRHLLAPSLKNVSIFSTDRSTTGWPPSSFAQLLFLEREDADKDIGHVRQTVPGGSVTAGLAIYDTMRLIKPDVPRSCAAWPRRWPRFCDRRRRASALRFPYAKILIPSHGFSRWVGRHRLEFTLAT